MKKSVIIVTILLLGLTVSLKAETPNLHLKVMGGAHFNSYVLKLDNITRDYGNGYQGGFGLRVTQGKKFFETDFMFLRQVFDLTDPELAGEGFDPELAIKWNSFQMPVVVGYLPYRNNYFKLFMYGGLNMHFEVKGKATLTRTDTGEEIQRKVKAKELALRNPLFLARMGIAMDFTFINLDFNYNIGMNSATKTTYRTQAHFVEFNVGFLF